MKSIHLLIPLLVLLTAPLRADITPKLGAFFSQKIETVRLYDFVDVGASGPDSRRADAKVYLFTVAGSWAEEMKTMAKFAEDNPKDKAIVLQLRSTYNALMAAKTDKTRADEAFRSLVALRRYSPPKAKVGEGW